MSTEDQRDTSRNKGEIQDKNVFTEAVTGAEGGPLTPVREQRDRKDERGFGHCDSLCDALGPSQKLYSVDKVWRTSC